MSDTVCVVGAGAWGTAIAHLLADNGYSVTLWCYQKSVADAINNTGYNAHYLPGVLLSKKIYATTDMKRALDGAQWIFEAVPVQFLRSVLERAKQYVAPIQTWVILSKGIEKESLLLPTDIIADLFGKEVKVAVLAGPSFAQELVARKITAVTLAAPDCQPGYALQKVLANNYFRPYVSTDVVGVQVGAALKNVIALGIGIMQGAGYAENTRAFLFTRGLQEMVQLCVAMGGRQETMYGLSGVGDLMLTCSGQLSRNVMVGRKIGSGQKIEHILAEIGNMPEGFNTVKSTQQLMRKFKVDLSICQGIYDIIFMGKTVESVFTQLMTRPLEWECSE